MNNTLMVPGQEICQSITLSPSTPQNKRWSKVSNKIEPTHEGIHYKWNLRASSFLNSDNFCSIYYILIYLLLMQLCKFYFYKYNICDINHSTLKKIFGWQTILNSWNSFHYFNLEFMQILYAAFYFIYSNLIFYFDFVCVVHQT